MKRRTFLTMPAVAGVMSWPSAKAALADDVLVRAMRDEMKRSLKKLQLENLEKPYFLSYRLVETETVNANASFGALVGSGEESAGSWRRSAGWEARRWTIRTFTRCGR